LIEVSFSLGEAPQGLTAFDGEKFVGLLSYHPQFCLREFPQWQLTHRLGAGITDGTIGIKRFQRLQARLSRTHFAFNQSIQLYSRF